MKKNLSETEKQLRRIDRQIKNGKRSPFEIRKELLAILDPIVVGRRLVDGTCPLAVLCRNLVSRT